jgi:2-oxoglutarate dehydrogenase E1 component
MQVVNATTPANFFHLLRRQMHRSFRKPLVVMTPKSLLRHPRCVSPLKDLSEGRFREILDDPTADPKEVRKLVFCSGKLYYELLAKRAELKATDVALIRIEQLYPFPYRQFREILALYPKAKKTVWSQEEPANMGARAHILLTVRDVDWLEVSAPESASPASGSHQAALAIQKNLINETFEI